MTTIAYDGQYVAADSLITNDGVVYGHANKIHQVTGGVLLTAGDCDDWILAVEWFNNGRNPANRPELECFISLFVPDNGVPVEYGKRLIPTFAPIPWAAGTVRDFAKSAMLLGKDAHEAVAFACSLDIYSGGEVQSIRVRD
ncbi:TPA: hypothetical protein PIO99_003848 [Klebsiella aerogenes]|nr:hypothetical protein [Klebsiella aerogenes]